MNSYEKGIAKVKVLIVGSGGREHAIATNVVKSKKVDKIYSAPGNAGIASLAECVAIGAMEFDKLVAFAKENAIDFTIIANTSYFLIFHFITYNFIHYKYNIIFLFNHCFFNFYYYKWEYYYILNKMD